MTIRRRGALLHLAVALRSARETAIGVRVTLDVLNAEQELVNSRVALAISHRNAYVAAYQLLGGTGGLIAIDRNGDIALPFNTNGMYRGYVDPNGKFVVEIYR